MRRTVAMFALLAIAGCREPRHLWSLDMGSVAFNTAVFAILEARAAPAVQNARPPSNRGDTEETRAEETDTQASDEPDAGESETAAAQEPAAPESETEEVEPPAYQDETAEELPRSDDELTADTEEPPEEAQPSDAQPSEEEQVEQEVAAEQLA